MLFVIQIENVQPIQIAMHKDSMKYYEDEKMEIASWGYFSSNNVIDYKLRSSEMEIMARDDCENIFKGTIITESIICTKQSHCAGDSGSMLINKESDGTMIAVGVASFGYRSCSFENNDMPAAYMKIESFLEFILKNSDLRDKSKNLFGNIDLIY